MKAKAKMLEKYRDLGQMCRVEKWVDGKYVGVMCKMHEEEALDFVAKNPKLLRVLRVVRVSDGSVVA